MSIRPDELVIANRDGQPIMEVVDDQTSYLVWRVEFQGAAVQVDALPSVVLRLSDAQSVTLNTVTRSSGEVVATVLASEIDAAGASIGDDLQAELTGAYTSGSDVYPIRHLSLVTVVSRATRNAVMYDELTGRYPQLAKACALPGGQTSFHPQMRIGLRDFRRELHLRFGRSHGVVFQDQVAALQVAHVLVVVIGYVQAQGSGQSEYWGKELARWLEERERLWKRMEVVVESGRKAWGTVPETTVRKAEGDGYRNPRHDGPVRYGGGM